MLTINDKAEIAEIYLSGDIVDDDEGGWLASWREGDSTGYEFPAKLRAQLDSVKDKELEIHINSYGGSVFAGVAMANFVASHKPKTTCIIDGIAASIASQIFFSADVCKIPTNGYVMLHKPWTSTEGNAEDLRKAAEILDTLQAGLETTYQKKALEGVTAEDIRQMMNEETWLTGTEAAQKFNVKLIQPVKALNYVGDRSKLIAAGIKNLPAPLNFLHKPQIAERFSNVQTFADLGYSQMVEMHTRNFEKILAETEALLNGRLGF